ncbi:Nucleoside-diphosphate-sugar epimerase [Klebsiella pneumoniae]|uniref:Nucleoside-diphosphate-sugar epimerase n=1 Tax=Klebsiella pneumoniae TaxID=573 RepID=A0A3S4GVF0_KLEPN|nr:Nucleoside-diphosphate-sugar epimerase [Klebsiella pneumoniae]
MKKVAIVGLGWLGMPLALSLTARGWQVTGSKTTQDGVEAGADVRDRQLSAAPGAAAGL